MRTEIFFILINSISETSVVNIILNTERVNAFATMSSLSLQPNSMLKFLDTIQ